MNLIKLVLPNLLARFTGPDGLIQKPWNSYLQSLNNFINYIVNYLTSISIIIVETPVTIITLQAAVNQAIAAKGGIVQIPAGSWDIDTSSGSISINGSVIVRGVGAGSIGDDGTTLVKTSALNDLFSVNSLTFGAIEFRDFGASASIAQNAGTVGIHIIAATAITPIIIENVTLNGFYDGIKIDNTPQFYINNNLIISFTNNGIEVSQPDTADGGVSVISNNKIWDVSGTAGANAGIVWHSGSGLRIHNNRILGAFIVGLLIDFNKTFGDDGALLISENTFEVQKQYCINMQRDAGAAAANTTIGQITIIGNHFQGLDVANQNLIAIQSSTPPGWVDGMTIIGNVFESGSNTLLDNSVILINDGNGINVSDNVIINIGGTGGGLSAGPNSSNVIFSNNNNIGADPSVRYPFGQTTTTIIDLTGLPFIDIPTAKDGSQIYINDGTPGTPLAGSGTGSLALRVNGAWKGL